MTTTIEAPPTCPECDSQRAWKDGVRYTRHGDVQRYLCRDCGYRFSESQGSSNLPEPPSSNPAPYSDGFRHSEHAQRIHRLILKSGADNVKPASGASGMKGRRLRKNRRPAGLCIPVGTPTRNVAWQAACAEGRVTPIMQQKSRMEKAAGTTTTTKPDPATIKGLIAQYAYWLEKEGYTGEGYLQRIKVLAKLGANLLDPEDVKRVLGKQSWKNGTRNLAIYGYDAFTKMLGIQWTPPKIEKQEEILPFIPEERELDQLIAACRSKRMATFLQTLKETFADPGEVLRLRWMDVNPSNNTISINRPVKGHNTRQLRVSSKRIAMLNALPKTSERIFPTTYESIHSCFVLFRKRVAQTLQNPRLRNISFTTFRHWGATMTYHYTRDILLVKKLLGHKSIESTMRYTRLIQFKEDEFDVATATSVEEAKQLLKAGFDYVTEKNGIMLFRKPKRFGHGQS